MSLSTDLISQFVKNTKDSDKSSKEVTTYGTVNIKNVDGETKTYVTLDGSDIPIEVNELQRTVTVSNNDRVSVSIKNHSVCITGNIKDHSVTITGNNATIQQFEILVADKVSTEQLIAEQGRIGKLETDYLNVSKQLTTNSAKVAELEATDLEVTNRLTAAEGDIASLKVDKLDAKNASITYATIKNLEAAQAEIHNLQGDYGEFSQLTAERLDAVEADIDSINAGTITAEEAELIKANIKDLNAEVAEIDTLIFGSASGDVIQSSFANAVIAQLGDAQIKSAMIESVSASKIAAGDIVTNNVRVRSEDGSLLISDETMQISDGNRVRVQIGKDASGDYSINIWDQNGSLMFSKGGITDSAIKDAIIRNDMVSDTANIAAHKLDIDSLFEEINGSEKTIKSTRVHLDEKNQSLEVAFKEMDTTVTDLEDAVSTQGTQISAIQGQITSKVWQQDINAATSTLSTQYSTLSQDLSGFRTTVSETYATKVDIDNIHVDGRNLLLNTAGNEPIVMRNGANVSRSAAITNVTNVDGTMTISGKTSTAEVYYRFMNPSESTNELYGLIPGSSYTFSGKVKVSTTSGTMLYLSARVQYNKPGSGWYGGINKEIIAADTDEWVDFAATFTLDKADTGCYLSFQLYYEGSWEGNFTVKDLKLERGDKATEWLPAPEDCPTSSQVQSAIRQTADGITSTVSQQYATKQEFKDLSISGRNLIPGTSDTVEYVHKRSDGPTGTYVDTWTAKTTFIPTEREYIISFDAKADVDQTINCYFYSPNTTTSSLSSTGHSSAGADGACVVSIATEWARYWVKWTQTVPDAAKSIIVGRNHNDTNVYIRAVKFEVGNKATAWSPALEDMATVQDAEKAHSAASNAQTTADNAETLIKQLSDSISMLVTDGNGTSLMTQTENGWTFSTADIQTNVSNVAQNLNTLTNELGSTSNAVNVLKQAVADLGEIAEYVKIGTYEGEPCIELGEGDSEFKMRITNTQIMFMEGSNIVAYISNQSLHIKKAVVEEELQQGGFVWKVRSNGNMGLIWKGVSS